MTKRPLNRKCLNCEAVLAGRSDKKFCDGLCRSEYHAVIRKEKFSLVNEINKILLKNREILASLSPDGKKTVSLAEMEKQGFSFSYFTQIHQTKTGNTYYYCYDYGYFYKDNTSLFLVKKT